MSSPALSNRLERQLMCRRSGRCHDRPERSSASLHEQEQLGELDRQGGGDPLDVQEANIPHPALDVRQISPVYAGPFGELLLSQTKLLTPFLDGEAESLTNVGPSAPPH